MRGAPTDEEYDRRYYGLEDDGSRMAVLGDSPGNGPKRTYLRVDRPGVLVSGSGPVEV